MTFGNWYPATKSGYKFMDDNQNGIFDEGDLACKVDDQIVDQRLWRTI
jgi:hypothetical protein